MTNEDVIAHIGFQLSQRLLAILVDNEIIIPTDAEKLLREMAKTNERGGPANVAAAQILRKMADGYKIPKQLH